MTKHVINVDICWLLPSTLCKLSASGLGALVLAAAAVASSKQAFERHTQQPTCWCCRWRRDGWRWRRVRLRAVVWPEVVEGLPRLREVVGPQGVVVLVRQVQHEAADAVIQQLSVPPAVEAAGQCSRLAVGPLRCRDALH